MGRTRSEIGQECAEAGVAAGGAAAFAELAVPGNAGWPAWVAGAAVLVALAGCALRHAASSAASYQCPASFTIGHSPLRVLPARLMSSFTVACVPSFTLFWTSASVRLFATSRP